MLHIIQGWILDATACTNCLSFIHLYSSITPSHLLTLGTQPVLLLLYLSASACEYVNHGVVQAIKVLIASFQSPKEPHSTSAHAA